jgi:hypothetical protein
VRGIGLVLIVSAPVRRMTAARGVSSACDGVGNILLDRACHVWYIAAAVLTSLAVVVQRAKKSGGQYGSR